MGIISYVNAYYKFNAHLVKIAVNFIAQLKV